MKRIMFGILALLGRCFESDAGEPPGPLPLPGDAPKLKQDVTVVVAGSSISMNRYGCDELPAWTGGYDRVPPQAHGQNVFFRIFEMLNDHENMCWRRLTDQDWKRQGDWRAETKLPYNDACYGKRVSYAATNEADWAELSVPAGYEKLDLIYTSDPKGDTIEVTIDGRPPAENALVDTRQQTAIPAGTDLGKDLDTLDSHGEPRKLKTPTSGIRGIVDLRARFALDPRSAHVLRIQRATGAPDKRILVWGAVYWRGNCVQVVQRAKGGINCGDLPNYTAIQEILAVKPDYLLLETINIRPRVQDIVSTLDAPLAWCGKQAKEGRFKVLVYATSMGNSRAFRAWFGPKDHAPPYGTGSTAPAVVVADENADACVAKVAELCGVYGLPMIDVGPRADEWLAQNPKARFVPHIQVDWYHPNQWGAAVFGQTIHDGIRKHWPELPVRPVRMPEVPGR